MKLKIELKQYPNGSWYYEIYERKLIFFWSYLTMCDTSKQAEEYVIYLLEQQKENLKKKNQTPVYYQLDGDKITRKVGIDGDERVLMGEPQLKLEKTEKL